MTLAALATALVLLQQEPPPGFTALFNGKDLEGWVGGDTADPRKVAEKSQEERDKWTADMRSHWKAENGELVNDGKGKYATTAKDYGDIELFVEYKTVAKADSGIYLRGVPQVQIWDFTEAGGKWNIGADKGSGGLWNNAPGAPGKDPLVLADKPFGEWNKFRILQVGARTTIWLNDKLVVDHALLHNFWAKGKPLAAKGPIQLQTHGGEIRWKNIFVREIPAAEANEILAKKGGEGYADLWNGKDFDGWAGPIDNYEIKDGAIVCKPGKGGTIYAKEEYGDFAVRLEFKVPPGGNNGLAIRYPGQGDTAYVGLCELQVLDDGSPKYAKLDARQYHGSVYGMIAANRGDFQRPVGEWNFQEVVVKGSTIRVELNGNLILEGDVSKVTEFMGGKPHPGMNRTKGYFGFAGHTDPVQFRAVKIRKLD
jgi:hypothetical protein